MGFSLTFMDSRIFLHYFLFVFRFPPFSHDIHRSAQLSVASPYFLFFNLRIFAIFIIELINAFGLFSCCCFIVSFARWFINENVSHWKPQRVRHLPCVICVLHHFSITIWHWFHHNAFYWTGFTMSFLLMFRCIGQRLVSMEISRSFAPFSNIIISREMLYFWSCLKHSFSHKWQILQIVWVGMRANVSNVISVWYGIFRWSDYHRWRA